MANLYITNARGVCLMRLGKYDPAVQLYRGLVLNPGCMWMRKDRPVFFKTNFATALLLAGHPTGCLDVLHEIHVKTPVSELLRQAMYRWQRTLPFWKRLDWLINKVEPSGHPIALDFLPGEFLESERPFCSPQDSTNFPRAA